MKPSGIVRHLPGPMKLIRSFHRFLGLALFIFVLVAAFSGVMRANAMLLYWKERPAKTEMASLTHPAMGIGQVLNAARDYFPKGTGIKRIELKFLLGNEVYLAESDSQEKRRLLFNAQTGAVMSPLSMDLAAKLGRAYVKDDAKVGMIERLAFYKARKAKTARPVFHIQFKDAAKTEVFIDEESGDVITVLDNGRRFGMWMIKLHEWDFAGISHLSLTFTGCGIIVLSLTGLSLGLRFKRR